LFDKLTVIEGDLSPLFDDSHSIAIEVYTDDYGNVSKSEYYPNVGDTVTIDYIDSMNYIDSRTGKLCTEDTPSEYVTEEVVSEHEVDYTVCALVEVPYSMGYRYSTIGYAAILPVETLVNDSGKSAVPMFYLFDTPDDNAEAEAEEYLADMTKGVSSVLGYESKATVREEFMQFKRMFMILGGVLCGVIAMVGILNFFNAIMTGIISRNREFAVLRAVGMTNGQLRSMLIYEGVFYTLCSAGVALVLSVAIVPLVGRVFENVYWFFEYRFTITPVILAIPVFLALGVAIPMVLYGQANRESVVERLRGE
jgi:putative ABC transport system permease protein